MKYLTYHQAIEKMASGHRVKRKNWTDGNYLYRVGYKTHHVSGDKETPLTDADYVDYNLHEDWIAYKEVKEPL